MQLKRVFIDTNVLVSAIAFSGNERAVINLALDGKIIPVFSEVVLQEASVVLEAKFSTYVSRLQLELSLLEYELISYLEPSFISIAAAMVRDPGDIEILAAILAAKPDFALTGDKDLLTDEIRAITPVCRCAEFLKILETDNTI